MTVTNPRSLWERFEKYRWSSKSVRLSLDISRIDFPDDWFANKSASVQAAYDAMALLEAGTIANPDEGRMVGHYWLRTPQLAPSDQIGNQIVKMIVDARGFAADVHSRSVKPPTAARFTDLLVVGIGGSALGPQLVADALATRRDRMRVHFIDNTDPDGFDRTLGQLGGRLKSTLVAVVSKSGGTPETRNGMIEVEHAYARKGLAFAAHAVAITQQDSALDLHARQNGWLRRFPMWEWVGGRTSVTSAVGLLPAALQGIDIDALLHGAAEMDHITRCTDTMPDSDMPNNPAAILALMWFYATNGRGEKDMVILPYKDRLVLLSRYLQQLIMESLGKQRDLDGNVVHQGIAVYGNKGSTDQHAYVQQLREGVNNFFATFIVVQRDRAAASARQAPQVEPNITSGDYLQGLWQGTRRALYENGRGSITIHVDALTARSLGWLIALYERAVGFYATLINVNAYHQPGVEAGKHAAARVLELQTMALNYLQEHDEAFTPDALADRLGQPDEVETLYHVLEHLAANRRDVKRAKGAYRFQK